MEFAERLFLLVNGLPVPEEPAQHLASGPSEPGAMARFDEQMRFNHAMGKTAEPIDVYLIAEQLTKAREFREVPQFTSVTSKTDESNRRRIVTKFSSGNVIAELDENNHVIRTYFEPAV